MLNVWTEILIIVGLTVINGVFAMSEIALVSARKARLQQRAEEGDRGAAAALALAAAPERLLSTVQVGISLISMLTGAFAGATIAEELGAVLIKLPWLAAYADAVALVIVVVGATLLSLILGELVPKRLALVNPEGIAAAMARPMHVLATVAAPLVGFLSITTRATLGLLRVRPSEEPPVTEEELKIMLDQGTQAGVFNVAEQDIVERVLALRDRRVSTLMTPRTDIVWIDIDDPIGESMRTMCNGRHSYFPVCKGSIEHVVGMASVKDQWVRVVNRQPPDIAATLQPAIYVPESMPALQVLENFKKAGRHHALVIDEYGSISGLVTLNDVLEAIVGDVSVVANPDERNAVQRPDGSWLLDGTLPIAELKTIVELDEFPGEETGDYETLAGFLMTELGQIPRVTDVVEKNGLRFEVVDMDGHRVDKVLFSRLPAAGDAAAAPAERKPGRGPE